MDEKLQSLLQALNAEYQGLTHATDTSLTEERLKEWNASDNGAQQAEGLLEQPIDNDDYSLASTLSSSDHGSDDNGYTDKMLSFAVENANVNKMMLSEMSHQTPSLPIHSNRKIQSVSISDSADKYSKSRSVTFAQSFDIVEYQQYSDVNYQRYEGFDIVEPTRERTSLQNSNAKHNFSEKDESILNHTINVREHAMNIKKTAKSAVSTASKKPAEPSTKVASFKDSLDLYTALNREANKPKRKYADPKHVLKISTLKPTTLAPTNKKIKPPSLGTYKDLNIFPLDAQVSLLGKNAHTKVLAAPGRIRMNMKCIGVRGNNSFPSVKSVTYGRNENTIAADVYSMVAKSDESFGRYLECNMFESPLRSRKCTPTNVQFANFSRKYSLDFMYMVFDMQMQLLGTYDINSRSFIPGIQFAPEYFNKFRMKHKLDSSMVQVIDINTGLLPPSAFAIIPIILDTSVIYSDEMDFQLDVFSKTELIKDGHVCNERDSKDMHQVLYQQYLEAVADGVEDHWLLKHKITSISQLTEMLETENTEAMGEVMRSQYATSSHLKPYIMEHIQQIMFSKKEATSNSGNLNSYMTPSDSNDCSCLNTNGSYIPFILFRSAGDSAHAVWLFQSTRITLPTNSLDNISNLVLKYMRTQQILPFTTVHIEHCVNCDQHQLTTRHVIESYSKNYNNLRAYIQSRLLPVYVHANTKACLSFSKTPRVGAFEVTMQPYVTSRADLVYSKIRNKVFPTTKKISDILTFYAVPKYTIYPVDGMPTICVHVYDAYYKQPIEKALVEVYQLYSYFKPDLDTSPAKISKDTVISDDYALVRTWAREDVVRWFRAFEVPENDIIVAVNAGVTTGPALMKLVTPSSMRSWGIKNLLLIQKLMASIDKMKRSKLGIASNENTGHITTGITSPTPLDSMIYCQEIKASELYYSSRLYPKSNVQYDSNDFDCKSIDEGYTDESGTIKRALATSGAYMLKIQSPLSSEYSSHILTVNSNDNKFLCVTLQPLLAMVHFSMPVNRENIAYRNIKFLKNGVLISVVNIATLRRHSVLLQPTSGSFLSAALRGKGTEGGSSNDENAGMPTCDFIQGDTFLPLGKYLSLVDGHIFHVFTPYKATKMGMRSSPSNFIEVTEKQALRCHKRQIQLSIGIFQQMVRNKLQRNTAKRMYTFFLIRIRMSRRINQARGRIKYRKAVIIQAAMRRYLVFRQYKLIIRY